MKDNVSQGLQNLIMQSQPPCVSLIQPTLRQRQGMEENRIRCKNLIKKAKALLEDQYSPSVVKNILKKLEIISEPKFWDHPLDSLCIFCNPQKIVSYRLPMIYEEMAVVGESFYIRPLLRALQKNVNYYLLDLSLNHCRFFAGNVTGLTQIALENLPRSLVGALGLEAKNRFVNYHAVKSPTRGLSAIFHGHGSTATPGDEDVARYFRKVDTVVYAKLKHTKNPLLLATPKEHQAIYKKVNQYPYLLDQALDGNFEKSSSEELQSRARPLLEQQFQQVETQIQQKLEEYACAGKIATDIKQIAQHAVAGRIEMLVIQEGEHISGKFEKSTGKLELFSNDELSAEKDILDGISELVLLREGEVVTIGKNSLPGETGISAMLRW